MVLYNLNLTIERCAGMQLEESLGSSIASVGIEGYLKLCPVGVAAHIDGVDTYKGGDDTSCQDEFLSGKTNLMVATKAFGMGIDKPNVRLTVHLNYPGSLESFVQEAGRAGRDKKMALATIMYSPKTFPVKNARTGQWNHYSADYSNNKFFYDSNFLDLAIY